jgi:hypothetical protein
MALNTIIAGIGMSTAGIIAIIKLSKKNSGNVHRSPSKPHLPSNPSDHTAANIIRNKKQTATAFIKPCTK